MDSKEFKNLFGEMAKMHGFTKAFGGWFKEKPECIAALELQKSKFGDYYQLNIKIFIQGVFGKTYTISKELVKNSMGHINAGETQEYKDVLDFDKSMDDIKRQEQLEILFKNQIVPFTEKAMTREGIIGLFQKEELFLLPAIRQELGI
jgi:hypothetical protein